MNSTTSPLGMNFQKELIMMFVNAVDEGKRQAVRILWSLLLSFLTEHWISVSVILLVVFFLSGLMALTTGRWGWFGSVLYNYLYFGILFGIGIIFGPEIFVNSIFDIIAVTLYIVCFLSVGKILDKTGLRKLY